MTHKKKRENEGWDKRLRDIINPFMYAFMFLGSRNDCLKVTFSEASLKDKRTSMTFTIFQDF